VVTKKLNKGIYQAGADLGSKFNLFGRDCYFYYSVSIAFFPTGRIICEYPRKSR
jgi:hypothetical protein